MQLSTFLIRAIFLAFPGILACFIYRKLKGKPNVKDWEDILEIALFSFFSYLVYWIVIKVLKTIGLVSADRSVAAADYLVNGIATLRWSEIIIASAIGIVLAYIASGIYSYQLVNKLGQRIGVTRRYGDEDVWYSFHDLPGVRGVVVRDHRFNLTYYGRIQSYSDSEKERELHLTDVRVFNNATGGFLYRGDVRMQRAVLLDNRGTQIRR